MIEERRERKGKKRRRTALHYTGTNLSLPLPSLLSGKEEKKKKEGGENKKVFQRLDHRLVI